MAEKSVSSDSLSMDKPAAYTGKKLRMAFIGCGGIAQTHLGALQAGVPEVEVVAGVDVNPDRLDVMRDKWEVSATFDNWATMLKKVQPDAVNVCTPNGLHAQPVIDSLNAGAHVIVEKPMAITPSQCQQMIDTAKKNNRKLAVGFQYRFHPATEFITRARDNGEIGNVMFVKCQALRRRGIPNWGVFGQKDLQGGGPMIDIGVHVIEMAHYTMGSPKPVAASGNIWTYLGDKPSNVTSQWPDWDYKTYTVEDLAIGQIRFETGALLQIEAAFAGHIEKDIWTYTLFGDKGGASWDPPALFTDRAGTMINSTPAFLSKKTDFPSLFKNKLRNFVDACMHDTPLRAPGEAGLAVQKMLDGIYRSAAAGHEVTIE